jgi:hypothetical protein
VGDSAGNFSALCHNFLMTNVFPIHRNTFVVDVTFDTEAGCYVGVCDGLMLATEAASFEALTKRVWEIAPELAQENGLSIPVETLNLRFVLEQSQSENRIAL